VFTRKEVTDGLGRAISCLGLSDWYLILHYKRFKKIICSLSKQTARGASGLEIGAWPGYLGLSLKNLGYKVTGTDLEPERLGDLGIPVVKLNLNSEVIPFADNSFEFVVFSEVVEHLQSDRVISALKEINRVLVPGGVLVISTPNKTRLGAIFHNEKHPASEHGHGHEKEYRLDEIVRLMNEIQMIIVSAQTVSLYAGVGREETNKYYYPLIDFMWHPRMVSNFAKTLLYPLLKFVPQFRDSLLIVARKEL
jgi:SAM-dependent methyltransferase